MDLRIRISKKQKSENRNPEIGKIEFVSNLIKTKNENLDVKKKNRNRRNQIFQNKKTNLDNFGEKKNQKNRDPDPDPEICLRFSWRGQSFERKKLVFYGSRYLDNSTEYLAALTITENAIKSWERK